jgi:hypothetical protein
LDPGLVEITRWDMLYHDPLYEVRLLAERGEETTILPPSALPPGQAFRERVWSLAGEPALLDVLHCSGLEEVWPQAVRVVTESDAFEALCDSMGTETAEHRVTVARAVVAGAHIVGTELGFPSPDGDLRDAMVEAVTAAMGPNERGLLSRLFTPVRWQLARMGTTAVERRKRAITDAAYPLAGDVLVYQTRGGRIRAFIREQINASEGPVVLLAHSLGGIACVDLLVGEPIPRVQALVTVGSQSPFLYELDCLSSLQFGNALPEHFPRWLNVYDPSDLASFMGAGVFPGRVTDFEVRSRQPFPASHSAYWSNPRLWEKVAEFLA